MSKRVVILTGLSGSGKTTALQGFEDIGFFTVDNVPSELWPALMETVQGEENVVITTDVRTHAYLQAVPSALAELEAAGTNPFVLFLDAHNDVLVRRYNFTRRQHPMGEQSLLADIVHERTLLEPLRAAADSVIDTSNISAAELKLEIRERFLEAKGFTLRLVSFGFKRGAPRDVDSIFDVRGLPNPYYEQALAPLTGKEAVVQDYVFNGDETNMYESIAHMVQNVAALAERNGRQSYSVAIGCTGGQHRSVAVVERLANECNKRFSVRVDHRDVEEAVLEYQ